MTVRRPRIVVLGLMSTIPVAGVVWQTLHYLLGFERLGYEAYYVEAHARTPTMWMTTATDDASPKAAGFVDSVMRRFGLRDRWAFHALHDDGRCFGLSALRLQQLYGAADLIVNLHGGTLPLVEHRATDRLVYVETDPVVLQLELAAGLQETVDFLDPHCAFFTFAENYGRPSCRLPVHDRFRLLPTRQPVVLDLWARRGGGRPPAFTTIASWRQPWRDVLFEGEVYSWSKHHAFVRFLDLPARTGCQFELALTSYEEEDRRLLEARGWHVRDALQLSGDIDGYRDYVTRSRGEFTVAKDQNVRLRTGWFSDRSATYLAAGRPVVTQETGFSESLPTGAGLFGFATIEEAAQAVEAIESDYTRHAAAAVDVARACFDSDVVLGRLLAEVGAERARLRVAVPLAPDLDLVPVSRRPTTLPEASVASVLARPLPPARGLLAGRRPRASIVVVTHDTLAFTRLCLESVLANTEAPDYELVVVDNGSTDGTVDYLSELAQRVPFVRVLTNERNLGFAAAANRGIAASAGPILVLLNSDTIVPPGWLGRLLAHLDDSVGIVGPVTNEAGNEAEIEAAYRTYGEFLAAAAERARAHAGVSTRIPMLTMFCVALRRELYERVGPLDERFEVGMFEDDDYTLRVRALGLGVACAEDVLVHHFGEASFGKLAADGSYSALFAANRKRFEEKWGMGWQPHGRRASERYHRVVAEVREVAGRMLPENARVLVVSKGGEELLELGARVAMHFPQAAGGGYAGDYPASSGEAIAHLEELRAQGADFIVFPETSRWWMEHYTDFAEHLERRYLRLTDLDEPCAVFSLERVAAQVPARGRCSIVIPVFNKVAITRMCVDALLAEPREPVEFEVIVVDDASTDGTAELLAGYGDRIRIVRHERNTGFSVACNDGAAVASGEFIVFLNNDTAPTPGWLSALVGYTERHPRAAAVGSKLLYPDGTVQHAGVVIDQDRIPRHIYAGFPADHPAVNSSRRYQVVTAACMLVRREAFESAGGFDTAFRNGYEDVDLCLRLGRRGSEVHYCHDSVVYHLESVSRKLAADEIDHNTRLYRERWLGHVEADDLRYYLEDGLLRIGYSELFPLELSASPLLALVHDGEGEREAQRILRARGRQVFDLLKDNIRLNLRVQEAELSAPAGENGGRSTNGHRPPVASPRLVQQGDVHWLASEPSGRLISVLIPVKNGAARLRELLPRVLAQQTRDSVEIVAIDSGSDDGSVDVLRSFGATVVSIEPHAFDHGLTRMLATEFARGELYVFANQSIVPADERWLASLVDALDRDPSVCGACSRVLPRDDADLLEQRAARLDPSASPERSVRWVASWDAYSRLSPHELRLFVNFHTVSAAIRPEVLRQIPFRSVLMGEDVLWAKEVLEAGLRIQHEPASVVFHSHAYSIADLLRRNVDDGLVNREMVGRRLDDDELLPLVRSLVSEEWRYLEQECGLTGEELAHWRLVSSVRRTAQALGQWIGVHESGGDLPRFLSLMETMRNGGSGNPPAGR